jgi:hypothetical protein
MRDDIDDTSRVVNGKSTCRLTYPETRSTYKSMTVADAIEAMGGTNELATALGVVPSAVRNWRRLNAFPPRLHMQITNLARGCDLALDDSAFRELTAQERVV